MIPLAHIRKKGGRWEKQELTAHLDSVAGLAAEFAEPFGASDWAEAIGILHDIGKADPSWQVYLQKSQHNKDATYPVDPETGSLMGNDGRRICHSDAGAVSLVEDLPKIMETPSPLMISPLYCIAGHHAGLADFRMTGEGGGTLSLYDRLRNADKNGVLNHLRENLNHGKNSVEFPEKNTHLSFSAKLKVPELPAESRHMWTRMLYSCLVDADFLDTEAFMNPSRTGLRGGYNSLEELAPVFGDFMKELRNNSSDTPVNRCRNGVLADCLAAAEEKSGFYSLTVPTGGGKTFASLAFALKHALTHKKRRIIVAIPYTSIIEQTADAFKKAFGEQFAHNILEHHSNLDLQKEKEQSPESVTRAQLAMENWEAPIVVTTNVQLFESLLGNRSSVCRKLHNIAGSVIILDEAQMLPLNCLRPVLSVLKTLVKSFGVTVLLCTATQPAFERDFDDGETIFRGLTGVREIVRDVEALSRKLRRVEYIPRYNLHESISWSELADDLAEEPRSLTIVNRRKDCMELYRELKERGTVNLFHLSGNMCAEHRSYIIAQIKKLLKETGEPVSVVSTQLVEAGVDLDFPAVYRAACGLDSAVQAGGRCNREGLGTGPGRLYLFMPEKASPRGILRKGETVLKSMLHTDSELDLWNQKVITSYYSRLYNDVNCFDKAGIQTHLLKPGELCQFDFSTFAMKFRMIEEYGYTVFTTYKNGKTGADGEALVQRLMIEGPHKDLMRELQRYTVSLPRKTVDELVEDGLLSMTDDGFIYQTFAPLYDNQTGINTDFADRTAGDVFLGC